MNRLNQICPMFPRNLLVAVLSAVLSLAGTGSVFSKTRFTPETKHLIVRDLCFGVSEVFIEKPAKSYSELRIEIDRGQGWEGWFRGYLKDNHTFVRFDLPAVKIRAYVCLGDNCQGADTMPEARLVYRTPLDGCGEL